VIIIVSSLLSRPEECPFFNFRSSICNQKSHICTIFDICYNPLSNINSIARQCIHLHSNILGHKCTWCFTNNLAKESADDDDFELVFLFGYLFEKSKIWVCNHAHSVIISLEEALTVGEYTCINVEESPTFRIEYVGRAWSMILWRRDLSPESSLKPRRDRWQIPEEYVPISLSHKS
jgi:hypothetical protein